MEFCIGDKVKRIGKDVYGVVVCIDHGVLYVDIKDTTKGVPFTTCNKKNVKTYCGLILPSNRWELISRGINII